MSTTQTTIETFSWLTKDAQRIPGARHAETTHDTAKGIALVLEMVEAADLQDDEENGPPLMSPDDRGTLIRLAIASARMLRAEAWEHIQWLNTHGVKQAT